LHLIHACQGNLFFDVIEDDSIKHLNIDRRNNFTNSGMRGKGERRMSRIVTYILISLLAFSIVPAFAFEAKAEEATLNPAPQEVVHSWLPPSQPGSILLLDDGGSPGQEGKSALDIFGYTYTKATASDFASINLNNYKIVFVSWLPTQEEVNALNSRRTDLANWISNGGGIVVNAEMKGSLGVTNPYSFLPVSFDTETGSDHTDGVHIVAPTHPLVAGLTDSLLTSWGNSVHGKIIRIPNEATVVAKATEYDSPYLVAVTYGRGRIVVCASDPEYHVIYGPGDGPRILLYNELSWVLSPGIVPRFLTLPFKDSNVKLQSAWEEHVQRGTTGIDYIKGTIDESATWQSFDIVAAADGWAMQSVQPGTTNVYGDFVLIRHDKKDGAGNDYFTLYAHLTSVASVIPYQDRLDIDYDFSNPSKWKYVRRGEIIGEAGSTGTNVGIHLHFEVQRKAYAQHRTDPYDLYKTRSYYPGYSNYVGCGSDYLWIADPPYVLGNLKAISIEPVQVLWGIDLIQDKATDFRIGYESTLNVIVESDISLDLPGFAPSAYQFKHRFEPGRHYFVVGSEHVSSPFFMARSKPEATFRFTLDPGNFIAETDETDNTFPRIDFANRRLVDTRRLNILFVAVRFDGEDGYPGYFNGFGRTDFVEHAVESVNYLKATYPVAESELSYYVACFNAPVNAGPKPTTEAEADRTFLDLIQRLALRAGSYYDHVVGVVRTNWFDGIPGWDGTLGYSWGSPTAVVVSLGYWKTTPHEIGHTYNLGHSNDNGVGYYVVGRRSANAQTFMSTGAIPDPPVQPRYRIPVPSFWIRSTEYQTLLSTLTERADPQILLISATFWRNGAVELGDWYRFPTGTPSFEEGDIGNYFVAQTDVVGNVLSVVGFNVTFADELHGHSFERVPLAFTIPFAEGTKAVQILNMTGHVVASKVISDHAPEVHVVSPNGGEILTSDHVQVSWEASDLDGDPLVYTLLVSGDEGITWNPVETGLKQTTYDLPLTGFSGGNKYIVKVISSDGANTAEDTSDSPFTIASFNLEVATPSQNVPIGSRANYTLSITSYGGFSNPIALTGSSPTTDKLIFRWLNGTTIVPVRDSSTTVVVEIEVPDVTERGHHTLILSGTSGSNTESAVAHLSAYEVTVPLDNTPPTTTLTIGEPKYVTDIAYVTLKTPFRLEANDYAGLGVNSTAYRTHNATYDSGWLAYMEPFCLAALSDGAHIVEFNSTDIAGNVEPTNTATVIIDNTPPTTTITIGEPKYISDKTYVTPDTPFILEATDTGSGVCSTAYRICDATHDSGWQTYTASFKLTSLTDGTYTIEYNSTDNVKNIETTHAFNVTLFSWNFIFEDTLGRGTTLKVNTEYGLLQFVAPDVNYGLRNATHMFTHGNVIRINHYDGQLRIIAVAVGGKLDVCIASAYDRGTDNRYLLVDKAGVEVPHRHGTAVLI
jgi:hypothetical protein